MPRQFLKFRCLLPLAFVAAVLLLPSQAMSAEKTQAQALAPAQPHKAVFYPNEAEVFVTENKAVIPLLDGGRGFLLALPKLAKTDSLLVSAGGEAIGGFYWLEAADIARLVAAKRLPPLPGDGAIPASEPSPERRALLEKLAPLVEECAKAEGMLEALKARQSLWEKSLATFGNKTEGQLSPADEAAKLDAAYAKQLASLHAEHVKAERLLDDAQRKVSEAEKALAKFDADKKLRIVAVPFAGAEGSALSVDYSYTVRASCEPSYRLNASPEKGEIAVVQEMALSQSSGFVWEKPEVFVSTLQRDRAIVPGTVQPWLMNLEPKAPPPVLDADASQRKAKGENFEARQRVRTQMSAIPQPEALGAVMNYELGDLDWGAAAPAPVQTEKASFRIWSLGQKRVEPRSGAALRLAEDTYKAEFLYTIRPALNPKGFLTARLSLDKALELPQGRAQYSVEGTAIGKQQFSFNSNKGLVFFGSDPQVTATMKNVRASDGQQGFINKESKHTWNWEITVKNARSKPIVVEVEDAAPQSANDSITIKTESSPKPESSVNAPANGGATIYRWKLELAAGEKKDITHKVEASAPLNEDMLFSPGRWP